MKRRLFTILSALSLVLCLACAGMGVRSGLRQDIVRRWTAGGGQIEVTSLWGVLWIRTMTENPPMPEVPQAGPWTWYSGSTLAWPRWLFTWPRYVTAPLQARSVSRQQTTIVRELHLPYWLLTLSTGLLPGLWLRFWWRRPASRQKRGLCRVCGYDLRASPQRCPECGTPAPVATPEPKA